MPGLVATMPPSPFASVSYTYAPTHVPKRQRQTMLELLLDEDWARAYRRVSKHPEIARQKTLINLDGQNTEAHLLHYLCRKKNVPVALVQAFVAACPDAARAGDEVLDCLPLHVACEHDASVALLKVLMNAYPEGLIRPDKDGNLPVHYACSLESPESALYLLEACPELVSMKNNKGQTPLHLACSRYDVSLELVQELTRLNEDACKSRDWQGRLPLHSACMWKAAPEVVELLLKCYPQGVRVEDTHKLTPYSICRKVVHLDHHDSTVKLLRSYQNKKGGLFARGRNLVQHQAENLSDTLHLHAHNSFRHVHAG